MPGGLGLICYKESHDRGPVYPAASWYAVDDASEPASNDWPPPKIGAT